MKGLLLCAFAQAKPLKKGQRLPEHQFTITLGDSTFNATLSDFKDKYILIDFWSKDCTDCIASMPKLLEVQKKFKDKLVILLVTTNTDSEIKKLFSKFKEKNTTAKWIKAAKQLPIVSDDSFFSALFPYKALPVHVWIKEALLFFVMSYSTSAYEENLADWTSGKIVSLDEVVFRDIDPFDPITLLLAAKEDRDQLTSYSILLNRIEFGMGGASWVTDITDSVSGENVGITCLNASITELYKTAYRGTLGLGYSIPDYRIIWNTTRNPELVAPPYYSITNRSTFYDWAKKNTYCYTLKVDPPLKQNIFSIMQKELDRLFSFKSSISKKKIKCRILREIPGTKAELLLLKKNISKSEKYSVSEKELIIENHPVEQFYQGIQNIGQEQRWNMPLLNEIRFRGNVSIKLTSDNGLSTISLNDLNTQLKRYGLMISEEYRLLKILLVTDSKY